MTEHPSPEAMLADIRDRIQLAKNLGNGWRATNEEDCAFLLMHIDELDRLLASANQATNYWFEKLGERQVSQPPSADFVTANAELAAAIGERDAKIAELEQQLADAIHQRDITHDELTHRIGL